MGTVKSAALVHNGTRPVWVLDVSQYHARAGTMEVRVDARVTFFLMR